MDEISEDHSNDVDEHENNNEREENEINSEAVSSKNGRHKSKK